MSKKLITLGILMIVLIGGFINPVNVLAQTPNCKLNSSSTTNDGFLVGEAGSQLCVASSQQAQEGGSWQFPDLGTLANAVAEGLAKFIGPFLMTISTAILGLAGFLFDVVIKFTIIDMTENIGGSSEVGQAITSAWVTLRDIANLFFIFILLFVAFKAMFELSFAGLGKAISNIIIIALLINFSLFFTKVVIDASNIVSVGFYKSILVSNPPVAGSTAAPSTQSISTGYMNLLGLQSWFGTDILKSDLDGSKLLIVGIMSSIFMLVTAVVLLISAIMFIARFIILIFLMILSPLALISFAVPAMKGNFDKWTEALISQSFFAPLFFALTWVVFRVGTAFKFSTLFNGGSPYTDLVTKAPTVESMTLVLNFVIIIGLAIAALIFSKTMATKTAGFSAITNTLGVNKVAGVVGGVSLGGAAAVGRRTFGAAASRLAQSQTLSNWAGKSIVGQKVKEGTERVAASSFDLRQTKGIGGALQSTPMGSFGAGKAGGYDATIQNQITKKDKVVAGLKTDQAKQAYAARQLSGLSSYAKGGSSPGHIFSLFGTMGRSNRIVASKIFTSQIATLKTDLNNGNTELTRYQNVLRGGGTLTPTQNTRYTVLIGPVGTAGSLNDIQDKITTLQTQVGTLGVTNTTTGKRADQQNY